jgi:rare lipoprotein A
MGMRLVDYFLKLWKAAVRKIGPIASDGTTKNGGKRPLCITGCGLALLLSGCSGPGVGPLTRKTPSPIRATTRPYVIENKRYFPQKHFELVQTGVASYYGGKDGCHGSKTAMGERFNMFHLSAAHKTLPLPSIIMVENLENGKKLVVRVNDRGPFKKNRILDVSVAVARQLGFYHKGQAKVRIRTLVSESLKLAENKAGFRKIKCRKPREIANLSTQRYYVKLPCGPLGKAVTVKKAISEWGKTEFRKFNNGFHVVVGPYSTQLGALQVCQRMPRLYEPHVICEKNPCKINGKSRSPVVSGQYARQPNASEKRSGKRSKKNRMIRVGHQFSILQKQRFRKIEN